MSDDMQIEMLLVPGLSDYHVHPDFSVDAIGSISDYCTAAIRRNLSEVCFTTHYDTNPAGEISDNYIRIDGQIMKTNADHLEVYVDAVRQAAEEYYPLGVLPLLGLEFGWYPGCEEEALRLKERFDFDYFLCGIHEIDNQCFWGHDGAEGYFDNHNSGAFAKTYFAEVIKAARSGLFDSIAHLDYYKRKSYAHYGEETSTLHEPYLEELFAALIESGTGLEVNTAAVRHGRKDYYPRTDIINEARKAGVIVVRLGSDAHCPGEIGFDFESAASLVPTRITKEDD